MGYYYNINETDFIIPAEQADAARDAFVTAIPKQNFHSTDIEDLATKSLVEVLKHFWCSAIVREDGSVAIWGGESKYYYQMRLLDSLAPFLTDGSFAIWQGEGGDYIRQVVRGGRMVEQQGTVTFS